ncbi:MAG TPA: ABC transporter permease [Candidatus Saccharimonadales bacterium]|nr:ABC transporter permease [Candidatus Saccharimonadales bacterium]
MISLWQDLRYAVRVYFKSKTFTLMAGLALAIGSGATTALFTVVNAVLLRPLPCAEPERIVEVYELVPAGPSRVLSYPWFRFAERTNQAFEYLAAWAGGPRANLSLGGSAQLIQSYRVSADFFRVFGIQPVIGRDFNRQDDQPGAAPVAVISKTLWAGAFGRDPKIIGRALDMNGESYTIVGVMPASFAENLETDVWIPLRKEEDWTERAVAYWVTGRLRRGVTLEGAQTDLNLVWNRLRRERPDAVDRRELGGSVTPYLDTVVGGYRKPMLLLSGAAACILLIACVNVANLLLARAVARRKEVAVRIAIGAGRGRLVRQLLTESALLSVVSGAAGFALAVALTRALKHWLAVQLTRGEEIAIDFRVLGFAVAVSVLTGIVFGLAPALQLTRLNFAQLLRDAGRLANSRGASRIQAGLVCAQIALSAAMLLAAGLLLTSFERLRTYDLGFTPQGVMAVDVAMTGPEFQTTASSMVGIRRIEERLNAIPGVRSAALVNVLPTQFSGLYDVTLLPDPLHRASPGPMSEEPRQITPQFFEVMRMPMRSGRAFTEHDTQRSAQVAIVNETFLRKFLPGVDPVGLHLALGRAMGPNFIDQPREIVGVVADTRGELRRMRGEGRPSVFTPLAQLPDRIMARLNSTRTMTWVIRTVGDPLALGRTVREEILKAEPSLVVDNPRSLQEVVSEGIEQEKAQTVLVSAFGLVAFLLAALGLYGTMSHAVAGRMYEFGIRFALGASRNNVLWLMLRYSFKIVALGLLGGIVASLALQRVLAAYLFGVRPSDPVIYAGVLGLLSATALCAALAPAMRAARTDPRAILQP